jgi:hypothetical protein
LQHFTKSLYIAPHRYPSVYYLPANDKSIPPRRLVVTDYNLDTLVMFIEKHASVDLSKARPHQPMNATPSELSSDLTAQHTAPHAHISDEL